MTAARSTAAGYAAAQQDVRDFGAGAQMRGQLAARRKSAEVDDTAHPRIAGGTGERRGRSPVPVLEAGATAHPVDEVIDHIHALERTAGGPCRRRVGLRDLDVLRPRLIAQVPHAPRHAPDGVACREQLRHESSADVPARPHDQAALRFHCQPLPSRVHRRPAEIHLPAVAGRKEGAPAVCPSLAGAPGHGRAGGPRAPGG